MKYYINFSFKSVDGNLPANNNNSLPTDPMYIQDGVYNQRCKYRMTNFMLYGGDNDVLNAINDYRIGVRFNIPSFNIINFFDNLTDGVFENPSVLIFPVNLGGLAFQSNGSSQIENKTEYNALAINTFTEEYVGGNLWGQVPKIDLVYQNGNAEWETFDASDGVEVNFTLEVEPIALKI